jgi:hypothetical protein
MEASQRFLCYDKKTLGASRKKKQQLEHPEVALVEACNSHLFITSDARMLIKVVVGNINSKFGRVNVKPFLCL